MNFLQRLWRENWVFIVFLAVMFTFRSACADWNTVPTGSMKPTIVEGDRILVNKLAYDVRLPFTHITLARLGEPERGDVVVFDSEVSGVRLVKRVVGIPGDTVAMRQNQLTINGEPLEYTPLHALGQYQVLEEALPGATHRVQVEETLTPNASFPPQTIPPGYLLVLGDNRDNSADSRVIGLVPRDEIVGRTRRVVISLDYDRYYLPRPERTLQKL